MKYYELNTTGFGENGVATIKELNILKETDKTVTLLNGNCSSRVNKKDLPIKHTYSGIITNDLPHAITVWNKITQSRIEGAEKNLASYKTQFLELPKDYEEEN
jgi:hypothetical protein